MVRIWMVITAVALTISQMHISEAVPSRTKEFLSDEVTPLTDEAERLMKALKELMQITSEESAQQAPVGESLDRTVSKRCTGLSTCVLGKLSQDILKLQTYPRTDVGAGTPGKKRSLPEQYETYNPQ